MATCSCSAPPRRTARSSGRRWCSSGCPRSRRWSARSRTCACAPSARLRATSASRTPLRSRDVPARARRGGRQPPWGRDRPAAPAARVPHGRVRAGARARRGRPQRPRSGPRRGHRDRAPEVRVPRAPRRHGHVRRARVDGVIDAEPRVAVGSVGALAVPRRARPACWPGRPPTTGPALRGRRARRRGGVRSRTPTAVPSTRNTGPRAGRALRPRRAVS